MKSKRLKVLNDEWSDCTKCNLANVRTQVVFGTGNSDSRLVLVGEAPGKEEDIEGVGVFERPDEIAEEGFGHIERKPVHRP